MIKTKLASLIDYGFARGVGHTEAMMNGMRNSPNAICILANSRQAFDLGILPGNYLTVENTVHGLLGHKRPILIDHFALALLYKEAEIEYLTEINMLEKRVEILEVANQKLRDTK